MTSHLKPKKPLEVHFSIRVPFRFFDWNIQYSFDENLCHIGDSFLVEEKVLVVAILSADIDFMNVLNICRILERS